MYVFSCLCVNMCSLEWFSRKPLSDRVLLPVLILYTPHLIDCRCIFFHNICVCGSQLFSMKLSICRFIFDIRRLNDKLITYNIAWPYHVMNVEIHTNTRSRARAPATPRIKSNCDLIFQTAPVCSSLYPATWALDSASSIRGSNCRCSLWWKSICKLIYCHSFFTEGLSFVLQINEYVVGCLPVVCMYFIFNFPKSRLNGELNETTSW